MTQEPAARKDTQRLQRAIVDGLEDVKAQDIAVFNTEHLSPLFERVIVASGTSNRQTKALAASVRDAVREAGFPKPRMEGEDNGEWIIVDCGAAVAHIMQPAIRTYYHLEEIWGDKPVRLKFGAPQPLGARVATPVKPARSATGKSAAAKAAPAKGKGQGAAAPVSLRRSSAAKTAVKQAEQAAREAKAPARPKRLAGKSAAPGAARKTAAKSPSRGGGKAAATRAAPARSAPARGGAAKAAPAKSAARRAPAKKAAPRKA